jgi:dipeptidyl aminopeptidase/acylaminoacyl peptidase
MASIVFICGNNSRFVSCVKIHLYKPIFATHGTHTRIDSTLTTLISPVTHVSKYSAPILLMHGTQDRTVPIAQSELLLAKYQKAGASAEFFKVEGAPHAFWNGEWFDDTVKRAAEFFRKQLGTTAATGTAARK